MTKVLHEPRVILRRTDRSAKRSRWVLVERRSGQAFTAIPFFRAHISSIACTRQTGNHLAQLSRATLTVRLRDAHPCGAQIPNTTLTIGCAIT
jgi:hypothetical protein